MAVPTTIIAVFEKSRTRSDLYSHWLDSYDVRTALTKRQADEIVDGSVGVAIVDQEFAGAETPKVLELLQSRAPACRIVATRPRSSMFPELDVGEQIVKPVFEKELVETVETLLYQANFHLAVTTYYQTTAELAPLEFENTDDERYHDLEERSTRLRGFLVALRQEMSNDDVAAVMRSITVPDKLKKVDSDEKVDSKYQPESCSKCGVEWTASSEAGPTVIQLAAHVWRCGECGHVQMYTDASHRRVNPL